MGISRHVGDYKTSERKRKYARNKTKQDMHLAIEYYSNGTKTCAFCGEFRIEFLTLDHINADPKEYNISIGLSANVGGHNLARGLRVRNWPEGIQILCYNCNMLKGSHITSRGFNLSDRSHIDLSLTKVCSKCGVEKSYVDFTLSYGKVNYWCHACSRDYAKKKNKSRKSSIIKVLGGYCTCCGESNIDLLSVEHSNNDGFKHRQNIKERYNLNNTVTSGKFAFYVLKDMQQGILWPGLTVHCNNCNCSKGSHGYCPHEIERGEIILDSEGNVIRKELTNV